MATSSRKERFNMLVLNSEQIKKIERLSIQQGQTHLGLMKKAGEQSSNFIKCNLKNHMSKIVILAGSGNNGGDGFIIAQELNKINIDVTVVLMNGTPKSQDAYKCYTQVKNSGIRLVDYDDHYCEKEINKASLIIDSFYGIGFHGEIDQKYTAIFNSVNKSSAKIISIDIPSGLHCDDSAVSDLHINADISLTFTSLKPCQVLYPSAECCGKVFVLSVGISNAIIQSSSFVMKVTDDELLKNSLLLRKENTYKGTYGTLLSLCGSLNMPGASILAARAAIKSGVGLVNMAIPKSIYRVVASCICEPIFTLLDDNNTYSKNNMELILDQLSKSTACLIGCGLAQTEGVYDLVSELIKKATKPLIIDAQGINIISNDISILKKRKSDVVLTPHPGEMARLLGIPTQEVQKNRLTCAKEFSLKYNLTLVLKGANTIIAMPDGSTYVNRTGNPGMSTGGSGDVLAGIISSFVAQGIEIHKAALCGVYIHGLAGDISAEKNSKLSMTPSDIVDNLPKAFLSISKNL